MSIAPWLAFIIGLVLGWLLLFLLERWFFRRRRLECEERLSQTTDQLAARDRELSGLRARAEGLEADLTAARAKVQIPGEPASVPVGAADVVPPSLGAELPAIEVESPGLGSDLPDVDLGALKDKLTGGLAAAGAAVGGLTGTLSDEGEAPEIHVEPLPAAEAELPASDFERLKARVETSEALAPELAAEAPVTEVVAEVPSAEVDWPHVSAAVAEAGAELPEVSVAAPRIGAELPSLSAGLPEDAMAALKPSAGHADDFGQIKGIGPKSAGKLAAAGITSFADLAAADPERLRAIVQAPEGQKVDYGAWVAAAGVLSAAPRATATGDDLTRLEGIGPTYAARLRDGGITTFAELAAADEDALATLIQAPAWRRVNYGEWVAQAKLAAAGDTAGLQALQGQLFSRKGDNLLLVSGVGERAAEALRSAGIASFADLAAATPERLGEVTRAAGVRAGDFGAWIDEARLRAAGKRSIRPKHVRAGRAVSCPQDLGQVKGIGSAYEQKLYAAGIGSFWELAHASEEELTRVLEIKDFQNVDMAAIKADALRLAAETGTEQRLWDGTPPDDFEPLEGIGEVYERRLYDAGICTFRALADATVEQLAEICKAPDWRRPDYAGWIVQAKRLSGLDG